MQKMKRNTLISPANKIGASAVSNAILKYIDRKIDRIIPLWVESYNLDFDQTPPKISIIINKQPSRGSLSKFKNEINELYGEKLHFSIKATQALKQESRNNKALAQRSYFQSEIERDLPEEFELINFWIIGIPLKQGSYKFLLCRISCDTRDNPKLEKWKKSFEDKHDTQVIIRHDWSKEALKQTLRKFAKGKKVLNKSHLKVLERVSNFLMGNNYKDQVEPLKKDWVNTDKLLDMTSKDFPWITSDDVRVQDREDAFYARRKENGDIEFSVAISETSQIIEPNSRYLGRARKLFSNIYYRNHTTHILPIDIAHNHSSFLIGANRRAIVITYTFNKDGTELKKDPEVKWANIKSRANIPPELISDCLDEKLKVNLFTNQEFDHEVNKNIESSLLLMTQVLPFLKKKIKKGSGVKVNKPIMNRFKGQGFGQKLVSTAMINFYSDLADFCIKNEIPFIAKNQSYPDSDFIDEISKKISETGTSVSLDDFTDGFKLLGLIDYLNREGFYNISDTLIDKYLLKTTYSSVSRGFAAFNGLPYTECKSRTFPGIINSMNVVAFLSEVNFPYSILDIKKEARYSNKGRKNHLHFRFIGSAINSIKSTIQNTGVIHTGSGLKIDNKKIFIRVPRFYLDCILNVEDLCLIKDIEEGDVLPVMFDGYDVENEAYSFSLSTNFYQNNYL